ncbi:DUF6441 family protein [Magnetospirillum gryphiswaldense]|uniref:Uncharacterized protein n=1 Tax=Magnetospirillum gryphiswaldense TaxID=55518 RepID=A4TYP3_9PROT|nr:DUF6441 family protein [Magnetospirillum gryphiswaldense]AVM76204.1 hypothetical protein MSR1_37460 [Magnetospirillum gryphiswaldense MSR-1]AVM80107.1 hypothetical protein MSR1L_37460 [Magnetospirillum gryphiswaldense]CAM75750.1 conserved hypothetical protein [Magnetospirillum gryphiswaldense MSR-1]
MKLAAAISGDLRKIMAEEIKEAEDAVTAGMRQAADGQKADLRRQVTEAGMGQRLANTWRAELYPKGQKSIKAAGFVFTRAPTIIRAFDQGALIKSKHGFWLAIPTPAAGTGARGKRMTPGLWEQMHGSRLRFIYRRGAPSLLVAENMRARTGKRGGFAKGSASALRSGRGMTTVVMFILVPQVSLKKRLDVDGVAERWASALPELIVCNW